MDCPKVDLGLTATGQLYQQRDPTALLPALHHSWQVTKARTPSLLATSLHSRNTQANWITGSSIRRGMPVCSRVVFHQLFPLRIGCTTMPTKGKRTAAEASDGPVKPAEGQRAHSPCLGPQSRHKPWLRALEPRHQRQRKGPTCKKLPNTNTASSMTRAVTAAQVVVCYQQEQAKQRQTNRRAYPCGAFAALIFLPPVVLMPRRLRPCTYLAPFRAVLMH